MNSDEFLWVQKYRPHKIEDAILPQDLKATFKQFVQQENIPNLLLTGTAGVGKTTVAMAMLDELKCDYIVKNGSLDTDKDSLRGEITQFASSVSFAGGRKYVILDEADFLNSVHVQPALRNFMEEFSQNCGFILTCNFPNKILEALRSRCSIIDFKIKKEDKPKLAAQFYKRCIYILKEENVEYDEKVVAELVKKYFPDFRRTLNELQRYSATGKIDSGILTNIQNVELKNLIHLMKEKDVTKVRKWVAENSDIDSNDFFSQMYNSLSEYFTPVGIAQTVPILGEHHYRAAFCANPEINIAACLVRIMIEADFQ